MAGPYEDKDAISKSITDATNTRQNREAKQAVDNATSSGGGAMKNSGTGNTFRAALNESGSGYTPLDDTYMSSANRANMTPVFSDVGGTGERYQVGDLSMRGEREAADAAASARNTELGSMSKRDVNKGWRAGDISDAEFQQARTARKEIKQNKSDIDFDSTTDAGIESRYHGTSKPRSERKTNKAVKSLAKDEAKRNKPSRAEKKSQKLDEKVNKEWEKYSQKHGLA